MKDQHERAAALAAVLVLLLAGAAAAVEPDPPVSPSSGGPQYDLVFYLWGAGVHGRVETSRVSTDFDMDFSDILDQLNVGAMGMAQVRWDRWSLLLDGMWMQLEEDTGQKTVTLGPGGGRTISGRGEAEMETAFVDLKGGYRLYDRPFPGGASPEQQRLALDLLAGARWWYLEPEVDIRVGPVTGNFGKSEDWADALVGARVRADLFERLGLVVVGDVGGFGIGSSSDFTWQVLGAFTWRASDRWRLHAGYRVIDIDRSQGSGPARTSTDVQMRGPVLGASFSF